MNLLLSVLGRPTRAIETQSTTPYAVALRAYEENDYALASHALEKYVQKDDGDAQAHNLLGASYMQLQQANKAAAQFTKAIKHSPTEPSYLSNLGYALATLGEFDQARSYQQRALDIDPTNAPALYHWLGVGGLSDSDVLRAEKLGKAILANGDNGKCIVAHFALGKLCDDTQRYEEAFDHYTAGNRLKRATLEFDIALVKQFVEEIKSSPTDQSGASERASSMLTARPFFIIGMPRSGSTLLEQVLAQALGLHTGGELTAISALVNEISTFKNARYPDWLHMLTPDDRSFYANAYLRWLDDRCGTRVNVVDKYLFNFFHVDFIKQLFPGARFIESTRDPMDTCLSCYFTLFSVSNEFSYDIDELAQYFALYQGLMEHWKTKFPDNISTVTYRDVVDNKQRVVDYLRTALHINDTLSFSAIAPTESAIYTASFAQARQPIYRNSLERWRRYGTRVKPLREALFAAGVKL